jgi:toxin ParE1/3/4
VARVEVSERALTDLERLFDFIAEEDPTRARMQLLSVRRAFELLADHPLLGREAEAGRRELILSRGRYGYIAKCRWVPA